MTTTPAFDESFWDDDERIELEELELNPERDLLAALNELSGFEGKR